MTANASPNDVWSSAPALLLGADQADIFWTHPPVDQSTDRWRASFRNSPSVSARRAARTPSPGLGSRLTNWREDGRWHPGVRLGVQGRSPWDR